MESTKTSETPARPTPKPKYKWGELKEEDIIEIQTSSGYKVRLFQYDSINYGVELAKLGFTPDPRVNNKAIRDMEIRKDDVIICAYPKCGTQWSWEIVSMLVKNVAEYEKRIKTVGMLEFGEPQEFDKLESPRVLNSHLPFRNIPKKIIEKKCKIIYVMRNPKDVAVSFYNHKKNLFDAVNKMTWADHIELFPSKYSVPYNDWYTYTLDWEKVINDNPNLPIHCMYYEDMKKDPFTETKRLAQFLGKDCDDQLIRDICEKCTFKNMKTASTDVKEAPDWANMPPEKGRETHRSLYRKGEVGDWKNWFTVAQNERFDAEYNERMKDSKLKFTYTL